MLSRGGVRSVFFDAVRIVERRLLVGIAIIMCFAFHPITKDHRSVRIGHHVRNSLFSSSLEVTRFRRVVILVQWLPALQSWSMLEASSRVRPGYRE
jgi:hypothetical protein